MDAATNSRYPSRERQNLQGAISDILTSLAVIMIPAVLLTAVLLGLITHNQVQQTYSALPGVPNPQATDSTALFVEFSATRLLTVASWISTMSSLLPSFAMTLLSYPVAKSILNASRNRSRAKLPTPYQLSMLLGVLNGSVGSLWSWVKYRGWKRREPVNSAAIYSIIGLVLVTVLGYLIVIADTWLHVTTSTIPLLQALPQASPGLAFGRGFYSSDCVESTYPCSVSTGNHGTGLINGPEGFQTLANTSTQNVVYSFPDGNETYSFIADVSITQETGFQARTFAVKTDCKLVSQECGLSMGPAGSSPFNCSTGFSGDLTDFTATSTNPSWDLAGVEFFQDPSLTQNFSTFPSASVAGGSFTPANPVYIGAYGVVPGFGGGAVNSSLLLNSDEFLATETQGLGFVMNCSMTVYDLEYVWYNGTVSVQQMDPSNTSVALVLTAPFVTKLANLATLAQSAAGEDTPSAFVDAWTKGFSIIVLAMSAGVMSPRTNIVEQTYISTLVARVPKSPLIMLVFLNLLYAVVGIILAMIAAWAKPNESKNVQGRLSVTELTAMCFESKDRVEGPVKKVEEMFAEKDLRAKDHSCEKVSVIESVHGGWKYELL